MVCERPRGGWTAWVVPLVPTPYCTCICACAHLDACLARSKVSVEPITFWECPIHCIMLTTYVTSLSGHVDVPVVCRPGFRGGVYAHRTRLRAGDSTQTAPGRLNCSDPGFGPNKTAALNSSLWSSMAPRARAVQRPGLRVGVRNDFRSSYIYYIRYYM